jgi:hypothetical protein
MNYILYDTIKDTYFKEYLITKSSGFNSKYNHLAYNNDIFTDPNLCLNYERLIYFDNNTYYQTIVKDIYNEHNIDKKFYVILLNFYSLEIHQIIKHTLLLNNIHDDFKIEIYKKGHFQIPYLSTISKKIANIINTPSFDIKPSIYYIIKYKYNNSYNNDEKNLTITQKKILETDINFSHIFSKIISTLLKNMLSYKDDQFLNQCENCINLYCKNMESCNIDIFQEYNTIYSILINYIFVHLAYTSYYNHDDYNNSLINIYNFIFDNLENKNIYFENYLLNSASNALYIIHSAVSVFNKEKNNEDKIIELSFGNIASHIDDFSQDSVYHEYQEIKSDNKTNKSEKISIYFVGFNSNHDLNNGITDNSWENEMMNNCNNGHLVVLIVDLTFEYKKTNLLDIYTKKYKNLINNQKMIMIYIKSFQKFVLLGSGKIKFGGMGIICNNDNGYFNIMINYLQNYSKNLFAVNNQNVQLLVHFLKYCRHLELDYVDTVINNINELQKSDWWKKNRKFLLANGPFIFINKNAGDIENDLNKNFPKVSTFGETLTTWSFGNAKYYRISVGAEHIKILNEKFKNFFDSIIILSGAIEYIFEDDNGNEYIYEDEI